MLHKFNPTNQVFQLHLIKRNITITVYLIGHTYIIEETTVDKKTILEALEPYQATPEVERNFHDVIKFIKHRYSITF